MAATVAVHGVGVLRADQPCIQRPVLLVIDDAHLSDTVSLFCVAYFLCTMTSLPIMILADRLCRAHDRQRGGDTSRSEMCSHRA